MYISRKISGATLVGVGLVCGALTINSISSRPLTPSNNTLSATVIDLPDRQYIPVTDTNNDGIEDWREEFLTEEPLILSTVSTTTFSMPDTITDKLGINLFESSVRAKALGPFADDQETLVADAASRAIKMANDTLYTERDILVTATNPNSVRIYGNTMGQSIINNNVGNTESELTILSRALQDNNPKEVTELIPIANMYKQLRDDALNTPVPDTFKKQHLDLINTYNAIYHTISGLSLAIEDPIVALVRIKRYEDDVVGLKNAFINLLDVISPYASVFNPTDPAFVIVSLIE